MGTTGTDARTLYRRGTLSAFRRGWLIYIPRLPSAQLRFYTRSFENETYFGPQIFRKTGSSERCKDIFKSGSEKDKCIEALLMKDRSWGLNIFYWPPSAFYLHYSQCQSINAGKDGDTTSIALQYLPSSIPLTHVFVKSTISYPGSWHVKKSSPRWDGTKIVLNCCEMTAASIENVCFARLSLGPLN